MSKVKEDAAADYGHKLDLCITDAIVKTGSSIVIGAITSVLFFRGRRWPIIAGMGAGLGLAYSNCEYELNPKKHSTSCSADGSAGKPCPPSRGRADSKDSNSSKDNKKCES